jgi:RNA polymerase sigma-70 factor (ECF subfamily)
MSSAGRIESESRARDEDLLAAAGGDPAARWRALEACRDYLRLVARRGRWSRDAGLPATSDLVQGTFVDAWRQFSHFRGRTPGQLRAWLRAILIHASLNARRRPRATQIGSARAAAGAAIISSSPSRIAQEKDEREALDAALGALPERHRTVIRMRVWDRSSFAQIGAAMGVSEDAARMLYARAFAALRESMRPGHDPG